DVADAAALQADGKIVVAGRSNSHTALARYNSDGSLDLGFGAGGKVNLLFNNNPYVYDFANTVAIQSDGKIVVAGNAGNDFGVQRYNANGTLDAAFGGTGSIFTHFGPQYDEATAVSIQADGKLVVAGYYRITFFSTFDFAMARYNPDGSLDAGFGSGGRVRTDFAGGSDYGRGVA